MNSRWTWHGGALGAARAHFGDGEYPWLDLSTGINPNPWPGADDVAIDWHSLPGDEELESLEGAAAAHFGIDPTHVCALPGTEIGLRLMGNLLPGPACYLVRSYRTHAEIFASAKAVTQEDIDAVDGKTLIIANPSNPDGRMLDEPALFDLLDRRGQEGWLLIDEAFADVGGAVSMASRISDGRRLVVFRSFGKFFGLAGLRLGFLLGPGEIIARMREKLGAWPVSAAAATIGRAAYRDISWIAETQARLREQAKALDAVLARHGYRPIGACPLFRLIEVDDASALFTALARRAILLRPFDYNPRWLRMGLPGSRDALTRLDEALGHG